MQRHNRFAISAPNPAGFVVIGDLAHGPGNIARGSVSILPSPPHTGKHFRREYNRIDWTRKIIKWPWTLHSPITT